MVLVLVVGRRMKVESVLASFVTPFLWNERPSSSGLLAGSTQPGARCDRGAGSGYVSTRRLKDTSVAGQRWGVRKNSCDGLLWYVFKVPFSQHGDVNKSGPGLARFSGVEGGPAAVV